MSLPGLGSLLGGPAKDLIKGVVDVVDRFVTTDKEKLEAQRAIADVERAFQIRVAEIGAEMAKTQASVIQSEIESQSWLARNWRPILMLVFTYIIAHTFVFVPLFGLDPVTIPDDMWDLLKLGMGGYVAGRTVEKVAETVTPAVAEVLKKKG